MKIKGTKSSDNQQVPGERLPNSILAELVKEAEKGPFLSLEEHQKQMGKWIKENAR